MLSTNPDGPVIDQIVGHRRTRACAAAAGGARGDRGVRGRLTSMGGCKGFFYHFLRYDDGRRFKEVELSTIETSLLLGGTLFAQSCYTGTDSTEVTIRAVADSL